MSPSEKPLLVDFEMSSEEMLDIALQPTDTCDDNYPLANAMYRVVRTMRVAAADAPDVASHIDTFEYDDAHIDELQESIDGFEDWFKDWSKIYDSQIEPYIDGTAKGQYDEMVGIIEACFSADGGFYQDLDIRDEVNEQLERIKDINSKIEEVTLEYHDNPSDEFYEQVEEELDVMVTEFEQSLDRFGESMQAYFESLRQSINQFKTMVKDDLERLVESGAILNRLVYPNDKLKQLIEKHKDKDAIVTAATPDVFVRKVARMEKLDSQLEHEEREMLISGDDDAALAMAKKRFSLSHPQFTTLLTYKNNHEARVLGKRVSIALGDNIEQTHSANNESEVTL